MEDKYVTFELYFSKEDELNFDKLEDIQEIERLRKSHYTKVHDFIRKHLPENVSEELLDLIDLYTTQIDEKNYRQEKYIYRKGFLDGLSLIYELALR